EKDPAVTVSRGTMEKKSFVEALGDKGVPVAQAYRIMKALDDVRKFDKTNKHDKFAVAVDKASKRVKAFEFEVSPSEIYQAKENDAGLLVGAKLDMKIAEDEATGAFYVSGDPQASAEAAGLEAGLVAEIDEAFNGRISHESFEEGSVVKVIAVEETALGQFSKYKSVVAVEYKPADPAAPSVRAYAFKGADAHGYFDDKGKQPYSGGWQSPLTAGMTVVSPFNPHRMHPVLHKLMPHEGTDLRAPTGTPIYSAYRGVIVSAGPLGPCGNAVVIDHPNGIQTGYCHMSRIATDAKPGEKVGVHHLIGYAGATGRATGPHLHFFAKKNGKFFDAMTLQLNGERVLPPSERPAFTAAKAELDKRLDAIPLPDPPAEKATAPVAEAPTDAPAGPSDKPAPEGKSAKADDGDAEPAKGGKTRTARQIATPAALASAQAAPGIHPKGFVEDDKDDDPD
ncbi:MAG TPA: M23 family metallopeptidase, partial [Byssovorax sp.]